MNVEATRTAFVDPPMPPALKLEDPQFFFCENDAMICLSPEDYRKLVRNSQKIGKWMIVAKGSLSYYRAMNNTPAHQ